MACAWFWREERLNFGSFGYLCAEAKTQRNTQKRYQHHDKAMGALQQRGTNMAEDGGEIASLCQAHKVFQRSTALGRLQCAFVLPKGPHEMIGVS